MPANPSSPLPSVTVLGLGAMGRALAAAFLRAGHRTTVWNRSPGRGDDLVALGAVHAATAEEAVRAGELVLVCVVDYDAAEAVLAPLSDALGGRVLVNVTSDVPDRSRAMAAWAAGHSIPYLDGAVMVPTDVIGSPEALIFYAGARASFERYESTLKALGGRAEFVGEDAALAAVHDLSLLDFFYGSISGLVHGLALAKAEGVKAADIAPYMNTIVHILPSMAAHLAGNVDSRSYPGTEANLGMMAASVDHILHAAQARGLDVSHLRSIEEVAGRAIAKGHGRDDWAATYEALVSP